MKKFESCVPWLFLILIINGTAHSKTIKGKHLQIATATYPVSLMVERNSSGHIVSMDGVSPHMLEWISKRYEISYSIFQINKSSVEGSTTFPGMVYYLTTGQCDVIIGAVGMTFVRLQLMDFSHGYLFGSNIGVMIPMPDSSNNVAAVIKPFQLPVWIGIICVIPCVLAAFYFSRWFYRTSLNDPTVTNSVNESSYLLSSSLFYISRVLLSQGAYCENKKGIVRIIASVWCLAAFVLVSSYNSLLISYVTSPIAEPLVNSIKDLMNNDSKINVVVNAGNMVDNVISNAKDGSMYKPLADNMRRYGPKSRCLESQECVNRVKSGNHAYVNHVLGILDAMKNDFQSTGKCNLALATKQEEYASPWTWALAKKSIYTEYINHGILEMRDFGLLNMWTKLYEPDVRQCLDKADKIMHLKPSRNNPPQLSLKNLTGAFFVLLVGFFIAFVVFAVEKICFFFCEMARRSRCITKYP